MLHLNPNLRTGLVLAALLAFLGLLTLRSEASGRACRDFETTVLLDGNRPVKAIGKACQKAGKWYRQLWAG
jgi:hypothetical protein